MHRYMEAPTAKHAHGPPQEREKCARLAAGSAVRRWSERRRDGDALADHQVARSRAGARPGPARARRRDAVGNVEAAAGTRRYGEGAGPDTGGSERRDPA